MTPEREAHILIVDDQREVARVLRTALELLNRGYYVVDVPSGEEALLELGRVPFDVLVIDYRLPGISGLEMLRRVRKANLNVKAILITGHSLAEVQDEIKELDIFQIFEKPINTSAFTAAVRFAIHGTGPLASQPSGEIAPEAGQMLDNALVTRRLSSLMADLGAEGIALLDHAGRPLIREGMLREQENFDELAMLLADSLTTAVEISSRLGEHSLSSIHYYEGTLHDLYMLPAGVEALLAIVFPAGSLRQMGPVLRYGRPAARKIQEVLEARAAVANEPTKMAYAGYETVQTSPEQESLAEPEVEMAGETSYKGDLAEPGEQAGLSLLGEGEEVLELELDLDDLSGELDLGNLGDLDSFWEEAASVETRVSDDALSLDEAVELGLIPEDKEMDE